ncbi:MAG: alpha/beta hydrolase [Ruminococcaceae bacterium]|nr:alpha/beta hydrolase [Oscillospiraceae bacterium]
MNFIKDKHKRKIFFITLSAVLALAIITGACAVYLGDYYHADNEAIALFMPQGTSWKEDPDGKIVFKPEGAAKGFIFYPGGKVEYTSYIPLMQACTAEGILCVLVEMPFNLAVLDVNAADGIQKEHPEIKEWYIGGHSLGGSMASSYIADHAGEYEGLILLGSYSASDISDTDIAVLSVYGSEDKVMNREKYENNKPNLPKDLTEFVIDGGCHAYFGMYGAQDGDGTPAITNEEQIRITVDKIVTMMGEQA